jgi:hypothetical protein
MRADAAEQISQIGVEVEAIQLRGLDDGVDHRRTLAASVGAGEQPVLAPERQRPDRPLGSIVGISSRPSVVKRVSASQRHSA